MLDRAKGPAGLTRDGQKYTIWGCGKVRDSINISKIRGAG